MCVCLHIYVLVYHKTLSLLMIFKVGYNPYSIKQYSNILLFISQDFHFEGLVLKKYKMKTL